MHLNLIIKANTHGSAEALSQAINQFKSNEIVIKLVHVGVGDISEADVMLAAASNALILGFSVKEDANALNAASKEKLQSKNTTLSIKSLKIWKKQCSTCSSLKLKRLNSVVQKLDRYLLLEKQQKSPAVMFLKAKFSKEKQQCSSETVEIFKGQIDQLKRFKDDVKEVATGFECGISFAKFNDIQEGDIIEVSTTEEVERQALV